MLAAPSNRLGAWTEQRRKKGGVSQHCSSTLPEPAHPCCHHCLWTPDSSFFSLPVWTHTSDPPEGFQPSASDRGCVIGSLVLRLPALWTEQLSGFPGSPVCRRPLLHDSASSRVSQSNTFHYFWSSAEPKLIQQAVRGYGDPW
jgi:hypothetical protein